MKLIEVTDHQTVKSFLETPIEIYKNDPNWVRPLDKDIEFVFDKEVNKFWRHGKAIRWILQNESGSIIGRVAAFINENNAHSFDQPTGGMGFFECINDQKAANILFDRCKEWLEMNGMAAMDGPINFGEKTAWWGLLYQGFHPPTYQMNYNPKYYLELFESYGFQIYYKQLVFFRNLLDPVQEKFKEKYTELMKTPGYHFEHVKKKSLVKYAKDFAVIYNKAWGGHEGFKTINEVQAIKGFNKLKQILIDHLIWFGYYKKDPIAFFIMIPDLNPIIKNFNGKLGLWQKLMIKYHLIRGTYSKCYGQIFGVVPEHQKKGVEGAIVQAAAFVIHPKNHYDHMEMTWIGDFNPKMINVAVNVGGEEYKTYITMRYLFDRSIEYKRAPIIGRDQEENSLE